MIRKKVVILLVAIGSLSLANIFCVDSSPTLNTLSTNTATSSVIYALTLISTRTSTLTIQPSTTPTITQTPAPTINTEAKSTCIPSDTLRQVGTVVNVVDGDTIYVQIDMQNYPVRYIGIDTPERGDFYSDEATNFNKQLVEGKRVTLVKDVSETDRYDRLLRYVLVDDVFVNYELVRQGYAYSGSWPPDTTCDKTFQEAEQAAKSDNLGLWALPSRSALPTLATGQADPEKIVITSIFYNGSGQKEPDEYVEIRNDGISSVNLKNWLLHDEGNKHRYTFPEYAIDPGAVCRVYTNEYHPEYCGFNFGVVGSAIWNNGGDCAYLLDSLGNLVDKFCYP